MKKTKSFQIVSFSLHVYIYKILTTKLLTTKASKVMESMYVINTPSIDCTLNASQIVRPKNMKIFMHEAIMKISQNLVFNNQDSEKSGCQHTC